MGWYKVYFLDDDDKIVAVENLECEADAVALRLARRALAARPLYPAFELWQADRRIEKCTRDDAAK